LAIFSAVRPWERVFFIAKEGAREKMRHFFSGAGRISLFAKKHI